MSLQPALTITVVDDNAQNLEALGELLEAAGYTVNLHISAQTLLNSERHEIGDCLITDLDMPIIDGFELCRQLRRVNPDLPIIFITARHGLHDRERADCFGHYGHFQKPFDTASLLAAVGKAVRRIP